MVEEIQNHIGSLNWGYRVALREKSVTYINAYGTLIDPHTIKAVDKTGKDTIITADKVILATGERPRYPGISGDKEFCITSDDLFSLPYNPGKTLVIGASYVALECAGFLTSLGYDTTVMVRSILLRGFDQLMAQMAGAYMEKHGTKFIRQCVPTAVRYICDILNILPCHFSSFMIRQLKAPKEAEGQPGLLEVEGRHTNGTPFVGEFNTV
ncbi:unnamed protein product [Protopolystoma xenopodis]|uniref:FAD/NAD(P)-binding domain-containing protein n=1 Tax=Protopolystoma xenopodis TaxID=117903 RepID=A0A448WK59_9PLAT|nr:unnamed protein product [Protopolystoma xenopodis]